MHRVGRQLRQAGEIDEADRDRLESGLVLRERGAQRVVDRAGRLAVEGGDDRVGLAGEDEVVLLEPPRGFAHPVDRASGLLGHIAEPDLLGHEVDQPSDLVPAAAAHDQDHLELVGVLAPDPHRESLAHDLLECTDQVGRLNRCLRCRDRLAGEVLDQCAQPGLIEHLVGRRVLPGRLVRVEPVELQVAGQSVARDISRRGAAFALASAPSGAWARVRSGDADRMRIAPRTRPRAPRFIGDRSVPIGASSRMAISSSGVSRRVDGRSRLPRGLRPGEGHPRGPACNRNPSVRVARRPPRRRPW